METLLSIVIDPKLLPWVLFLNVAGIWLKRGKLPSWMPPIPILLFLISFIICCVFGWIHTEATGAKAMLQIILEYGLANGLVMTLIATWGYDIVHAYTKKEWNKI